MTTTEKLVRVPFNLETAKMITDKEILGRIITRSGDIARILSFDRKDDFFPIIALIDNGEKEIVCTLSLDGKAEIENSLDTKDLMLEIPEYMIYRIGDILIDGADMPFIYNGHKDDKWGYGCICGLNYNEELYINLDASISSWTFVIKRRANDEEKQKLIDALKESHEPIAKEYLKRFFGIEDTSKNSNVVNIEKDFKLKPFDKVLVRDDDFANWRLDFFSNIDTVHTVDNECTYQCIWNHWNYCIPYEGNEHLLNTNNSQ